ncbi:sigma-54-dependent Fis family transcriptional regulator, partial [bacterium]|nr:sigma-54-dependent Fis family transcriptional regulator [bacterium]
MNNQVNILIVDDDSNILEVLDARLSAADFNVFKASDGLSAIQILKTTPVELMISDIKMPAMSGTELFSEIKKILPELPVIFLTAHGTIPGAVNAVQNGAVDYISKPFDGKQLVEKINKILARVKTSAEEKNSPLIEDGFYWGKSPVMQELNLTIKKVAASDVNVLILG